MRDSLLNFNVEEIKKQLFTLKNAEEISSILHNYLGVSQDHLNFLMSLGGVSKLREFFFEVLEFDLTYGIETSTYIPESNYLKLAERNSNLLANPGQVAHGVKHRASLTSPIIHALNGATAKLLNLGINLDLVRLTDIGCGLGKVIIVATANGIIDHPFKRAIGIDYFQNNLEIARQNIQSNALGISEDCEIQFVFTDATIYQDFAGVNVVYMYNPFDEYVMKDVERNLRRYAGKVILIYTKPIHENLFKSKGWKWESRYISYNDSCEDLDSHVVIYSWGLNLI